MPSYSVRTGPSWIYWLLVALILLWMVGLVPGWVLALPAVFCCLPPLLLVAILLLLLSARPKDIENQKEEEEAFAGEDVIDAEFEVVEEN